jgi:hypothetical protein
MNAIHLVVAAKLRAVRERPSSTLIASLSLTLSILARGPGAIVQFGVAPKRLAAAGAGDRRRAAAGLVTTRESP